MYTEGLNFYFSSVFTDYVLSNALFKVRVLHYGIRAVRAYRTMSYVSRVIQLRKSVSYVYESEFSKFF